MLPEKLPLPLHRSQGHSTAQGVAVVEIRVHRFVTWLEEAPLEPRAERALAARCTHPCFSSLLRRPHSWPTSCAGAQACSSELRGYDHSALIDHDALTDHRLSGSNCADAYQLRT